MARLLDPVLLRSIQLLPVSDVDRGDGFRRVHPHLKKRKTQLGSNTADIWSLRPILRPRLHSHGQNGVLNVVLIEGGEMANWNSVQLFIGGVTASLVNRTKAGGRET